VGATQDASSELSGSLSIRDSARITGITRSEIRRSIEAGGFPGARKDASGIWKIPLADLLVAGITIDLEECDLMVVASTALAEVRRLEAERGATRGPEVANANGTSTATDDVSEPSEDRQIRLAKPVLHWPIGEDA
jgi:hypothetical protein